MNASTGASVTSASAVCNAPTQPGAIDRRSHSAVPRETIALRDHEEPCAVQLQFRKSRHEGGTVERSAAPLTPASTCHATTTTP